MTHRYAVVANGQVLNVVMWDGATDSDGKPTWTPAGGAEAIEIADADIATSIGWTYDGTSFAPPPASD